MLTFDQYFICPSCGNKGVATFKLGEAITKTGRCGVCWAVIIIQLDQMLMALSINKPNKEITNETIAPKPHKTS